MTSCADILGQLSGHRLAEFAQRHDVHGAKEHADEELAESIGKAAGDKLLAMLAELDDHELATVCERLDLEPGELARLAAPPRSRADCVDGLRPCPYKSCRYHLDEGPEPVCVLDVADDGGADRSAVAKMMGLTPERVRQIEELAFRRAKSRGALLRLGYLAERPGLEWSPEFGGRPALDGANSQQAVRGRNSIR